MRRNGSPLVPLAALMSDFGEPDGCEGLDDDAVEQSTAYTLTSDPIPDSSAK